MVKHSVLFFFLLFFTIPVLSADLYLLEFDLLEGEKLIERGKTNVTHNSHTWNRGLTRSYLKLNCHQLESRKIEKRLSTVDLFSGLLVTHQLVGNQLEVKVKYSTVKPQLVEIRALSKNECKNLSPIFTSTSEIYTYPAKNQAGEARQFGDRMSFRAKITSLGVSR